MLLALAVISCLVVGPVSASPITYDFTGTLRDGFANGSTDFSGSFTIDGDPTLQPDGSVDEKGSDVSITLNIGGQTYKYENNANTEVELTVGTSPSWHDDPQSGPRQDGILLQAVDHTGGASLPLFIASFYTPSSLENLTDLRTLNFIPVAGHAAIGTPVYGGDGKFTSITLVQNTPEPGAFVVFALAGVAAVVKLQRR